MRRNTGVLAGLLVVLTFLGVLNLPKPSGEARAVESKQALSRSSNEAKPSSPCVEVGLRLRRFLNATDSASLESWKLPNSCYPNGRTPDKATPVSALPGVEFVIATVPNPVATHLPLLFDRIVETIQQAAQDEAYLYDASWFPWDVTRKDYSRFTDQQTAADLQRIQEAQPGVMVFRRADNRTPYDDGLVVFLVAEQPTGGITEEQFQSALEWIRLLRGFSKDLPLRILGPTFSGSLPSLQRVLQRELISGRPAEEVPIQVSSGTVSSPASYQQFDTWIQERVKKQARQQPKSYFRTALENDSLMQYRFCQYLKKQHYDLRRVAVLSEDQTAFGLRPQNPPCLGALPLYYPRDIATLRSAYESQSIFSPPRPQADNASSATLRGDLSEPASSEHDSVRRYSGQLTPLAQESILFDITSQLREHRIQFIILQSTNSLDQIFLTEFFRRSDPEARLVIDGADLLFTRGTQGRSLRGVMLLSTYPLLTLEPGVVGHRTFEEDAPEGEYIAARELLHDRNPSTPVPIYDYSPPAWPGYSPSEKPPTWITVIGHRRFWPVAALTDSPPEGDSASILQSLSTPRGELPAVGPLRLPVTMWVFLLVCLAWSLLHLYFCSSGSMMGSPRARAYFAPLPRWQHPALIALGSLVIAMLAVVVAANSGMFSWGVIAFGFQDRGTVVLLALSLLLTFALALLACRRNYALDGTARSLVPEAQLRAWQVRAGVTAIVCLALFALVHVWIIFNLTPENAIPVYWRSVHLTSGVSPLLPQLLLLCGAYLWFWCNLRGLAHFGPDRPRLPRLDDLPKVANIPLMPMFSWDKAARFIEDAARPLTRGYSLRLFAMFGITVGTCAVALQGMSVRSLGERAFGRLIFFSFCLTIAAILADGLQIWRTWCQLRQLLVYLDRLPLRRTLRALKGLAWGSIWKVSGNVLEERYRVISLQLESLRHLTNMTAKSLHETRMANNGSELLLKLKNCRTKADEFAIWYVSLPRDRPVRDLRPLREFQEEVASTAAVVMKCVLVPAWRRETESLIFDRAKPEGEAGKEATGDVASSTEVAPHMRAAEEFFVFPYLAFIQNILGRMRTIALGSLWLFIGTTLAISSYPFEPLNVLGGIFLAVFVFNGGLTTLVYSQMCRDATLSHITNTEPGALGWDFWGRVLTFGAGPLIGLLTTLFPSIANFVYAWFEPGMQAVK